MTGGEFVVYVVIPSVLLTAWAIDRYRNNRRPTPDTTSRRADDGRSNHTFTRPPR